MAAVDGSHRGARLCRNLRLEHLPQDLSYGMAAHQSGLGFRVASIGFCFRRRVAGRCGSCRPSSASPLSLS